MYGWRGIAHALGTPCLHNVPPWRPSNMPWQDYACQVRLRALRKGSCCCTASLCSAEIVTPVDLCHQIRFPT
eukprot:1148073-Pelagomonas_calceolata.AAC.4